MNNNEFSVIKEIALQLLTLCSQSEIDLQESEERTSRQRAFFIERFKAQRSVFAERNEDLQLNTRQKIINSEKDEGEEELIKLKYGEGSIGIRTRVRKKDGSIYRIYAGTYYNEFGQHKTVYAKTQKECLRKLKGANPKKKKAQEKITCTIFLF